MSIKPVAIYLLASLFLIAPSLSADTASLLGPVLTNKLLNATTDDLGTIITLREYSKARKYGMTYSEASEEVAKHVASFEERENYSQGKFGEINSFKKYLSTGLKSLSGSLTFSGDEYKINEATKTKIGTKAKLAGRFGIAGDLVYGVVDQGLQMYFDTEGSKKTLQRNNDLLLKDDARTARDNANILRDDLLAILGGSDPRDKLFVSNILSREFGLDSTASNEQLALQEPEVANLIKLEKLGKKFDNLNNEWPEAVRAELDAAFKEQNIRMDAELQKFWEQNKDSFTEFKITMQDAFSSTAETLNNINETVTDNANKLAAIEQSTFEKLVRQRKYELKQQETAVLRTSVNLLATGLSFLDEKKSREFSIVAHAGLDIKSAVDAFNALEQQGTLATAALTLNIASIGMSVVTSFVDTGPSPDELILEQLAAIQEQIQQVRVEMHERFDAIDDKLDKILGEIELGFESLKKGQQANSKSILFNTAIGLNIQSLIISQNDNLIDILTKFELQPCYDAATSGTSMSDFDYQACLSKLRVNAIDNLLTRQVVYNPDITGPELMRLVETGKADNVIYNIYKEQLSGATASTLYYEKLPSFEDWYLSSKYYLDFLANSPQQAQKILSLTKREGVVDIYENIKAYTHSIKDNIKPFTDLATSRWDITSSLVESSWVKSEQLTDSQKGYTLLPESVVPGFSVFDRSLSAYNTFFGGKVNVDIYNIAEEELGHLAERVIWGEIPNFIQNAVYRNHGYITYEIDQTYFHEDLTSGVFLFGFNSSYKVDVFYHSNDKDQTNNKVRIIEIDVKKVFTSNDKNFLETLNERLAGSDSSSSDVLFKYFTPREASADFFRSAYENYEADKINNFKTELQNNSDHDNETDWVNAVLSSLVTVGYYDGIGKDQYIHSLASRDMQIYYLRDIISLLETNPDAIQEYIEIYKTEQKDAYLKALAHLNDDEVKEFYGQSETAQLLADSIEIGLKLIPHMDGGTDSDNDGVNDQDDAFPNDENESLDTDSDGIGNNTDTDDDNDGMPDIWELTNQLDPTDASDATQDSDQDNVVNLEEYINNTEPNNADSDNDGILDDQDTVFGNGLWGYACNVVHTPDDAARQWRIDRYDLSSAEPSAELTLSIGINRKIQSVACNIASNTAIYSVKENRNGDYEIYELNLTSGETEQITQNDTDDVDVTRSRDGRVLAWQKRLADGRQAIELRHTLDDGEYTYKTLASANPFVQPSLSPNGMWLVLVQLRQSSFVVVRYDIENNQYKEVARVPRRKKLYHPSITDDGNIVGWVANVSKRLYRVKNISENTVINLLNDEDGIEHPVLTGDGAKVIYSINRNGTGTFNLTDISTLDTTYLGQVLNGSSRYLASNWSGTKVKVAGFKRSHLAGKTLKFSNQQLTITLNNDQKGYITYKDNLSELDIEWGRDSKERLTMTESATGLKWIVHILSISGDGSQYTVSMISPDGLGGVNRLIDTLEKE